MREIRRAERASDDVGVGDEQLGDVHAVRVVVGRRAGGVLLRELVVGERRAGEIDLDTIRLVRQHDVWRAGRWRLEEIVAARVGDGRERVREVVQHDRHAADARLTSLLNAVAIRVEPDKVADRDRRALWNEAKVPLQIDAWLAGRGRRQRDLRVRANQRAIRIASSAAARL